MGENIPATDAPVTDLVTDLVTELRDKDWSGPMQLCRDWHDLDILHERAAREIESLRHHVKALEYDLRWWRDARIQVFKAANR